MKLRAIFILILLVGIVYGTSVALADPPDPFKGSIQLYPRTIRLGETITVQCEYTPLEGASLGVDEWGLYAQYGTANVIDFDIIRSREDHGPFIWKLEVKPDTVGKGQVSVCG
ncbi:MAG: hypothetical protein EHM35_02045, partial [Planctomycetaceae bacterium]